MVTYHINNQIFTDFLDAFFALQEDQRIITRQYLDDIETCHMFIERFEYPSDVRGMSHNENGWYVEYYAS